MEVEGRHCNSNSIFYILIELNRVTGKILINDPVDKFQFPYS